MSRVMLNGDLLDEREAMVSALDQGLTHGVGLYETIKLTGRACAFFDEHAGRLEKGLAALHIPCPFDRDDLARQILAVAAGNDVRDGACRLLVTAGPPWGDATLLVQTDTRTFPERPLTAISYRIARAAAAFKSNSFVPSLVAKRAAEAGADDAIFVDDDGRILEATTSNCFVHRGGVLTTPPLDGSILPGVIRGKIMQLAEADGMAVAERHIRISELTPNDSVLLTSSVRGIVLVSSVDGVPLRLDEEHVAAAPSSAQPNERAAAFAQRLASPLSRRPNRRAVVAAETSRGPSRSHRLHRRRRNASQLLCRLSTISGGSSAGRRVPTDALEVSRELLVVVGCDLPGCGVRPAEARRVSVRLSMRMGPRRAGRTRAWCRR
jgi:branched-subunit amino acid aminotransferase/4-amino-4-deoxychorismate lyase